MDNYAKESYKWSLAVAALGMLLGIISIATPEWTVTDGKVIGLWVLQSDGQDYPWTGTSEYSEDFFYASFMQACRGMMMAGIMLGGFGLLYHLVVMKRKTYSMTNAVLLFGYYMLSGLLLLITGTVYGGMIPQPVCPGYPTPCAEDVITSYNYTGNYGYSFWLCWIAGGILLLPAAIVYEGGRHNLVSKQNLDLQSKVNEFRKSKAHSELWK